LKMYCASGQAREVKRPSSSLMINIFRGVKGR
jgi:hypothetical protein